MNNAKAMQFFKDLASNSSISPKSVKLAAQTDFTDVDARFILNYADLNSDILDIGTGTGLIVQKIYSNVRSIECVEPYVEFAKFIPIKDNITVGICNVFNYKTDKKYDVITAFGVMHYFNRDEAIEVYEKLYAFLKNDGYIIVKNQFGIIQDVNVAGYSHEQKCDYYSQYRHIDSEVGILKQIGFSQTNVFDIYPPEANRWDNTHFYAIVAKR